MKSVSPLALAVSATSAATVLAAIILGHGPAAGSSATHTAQPPAAAPPSGPQTPGEPGTGNGTAAAVTPAGCTPETRYLLNEDGTVTPVYSCPGPAPGLRHAYESYPTAALESLAYADARAAEILGMRLRDSDRTKALGLTIRAAALSGGDPAPILAFSNAYPEPTAIDDVPVRRTVHTKFILSAVADLLGAEHNNLAYWEAQIRQLSTDPEREIELLQRQARRIVEEMRRIEVELTGSSAIGGQSDA